MSTAGAVSSSDPQRSDDVEHPSLAAFTATSDNTSSLSRSSGWYNGDQLSSAGVHSAAAAAACFYYMQQLYRYGLHQSNRSPLQSTALVNTTTTTTNLVTDSKSDYSAAPPHHCLDWHGQTNSRSSSPDTTRRDDTAPRPSPDGTAVCHVCNQAFLDNLVLKEHIEKLHPREMYRCTVPGCDKIFSTRKSRNRHSQNDNLHYVLPFATSHIASQQLQQHRY